MDSHLMGTYLFKLRKERQLTQKDIAKLCSISPQAVSKWERGESVPDIESLEKMSILYNLSINEIICGEKAIVDKKSKSKVILKLILSIVIVFTYILPMIELNGVVFRGFEIIYKGIQGPVVLIAWLILVSAILLIGLMIMFLTDTLKNSKIYNEISNGLLLGLIAILLFSNFAYGLLFIPLIIIGVCYTGLILINYSDNKTMLTSDDIKYFNVSQINQLIAIIAFYIVFLLMFGTSVSTITWNGEILAVNIEQGVDFLLLYLLLMVVMATYNFILDKGMFEIKKTKIYISASVAYLVISLEYFAAKFINHQIGDDTSAIIYSIVNLVFCIVLVSNFVNIYKRGKTNEL